MWLLWKLVPAVLRPQQVPSGPEDGARGGPCVPGAAFPPGSLCCVPVVSVALSTCVQRSPRVPAAHPAEVSVPVPCPPGSCWRPPPRPSSSATMTSRRVSAAGGRPRPLAGARAEPPAPSSPPAPGELEGPLSLPRVCIGNILLLAGHEDSSDKLMLIDFEYSSYNYRWVWGLRGAGLGRAGGQLCSPSLSPGASTSATTSASGFTTTPTTPGPSSRRPQRTTPAGSSR